MVEGEPGRWDGITETLLLTAARRDHVERTIRPALERGDWVICDPTVRSRDDAIAPDITLQGVSARGEGGMQLQKYFHDGSFAEQIRVPTENVKRLGRITDAEAARWCALKKYLWLPCWP